MYSPEYAEILINHSLYTVNNAENFGGCANCAHTLMGNTYGNYIHNGLEQEYSQEHIITAHYHIANFIEFTIAVCEIRSV